VTCYHDITKLDGRDLRGVDIISGGFPCQDLSVAGKRAGLSGTRSGLFFQLARVVEEARPRLLVWENVPGLLSSSAGNAMRTVCGELARIGYFGAWRVLDSRFHGVPQRRRRVFGAFAPRSAGGWACGAAVLLESEGGDWDPAESCEARSETTADAGEGDRGYVPEVVGQAMSAKWAKGSSGPAGDEHHNLVAFGETGPGFWREGVSALRAEGENRPSRPSHVVIPENVAMTPRPDGEGRGSSGGKQYILYDRTSQNNRILSPDGIAQPHRANASGGSDLVQAQGVRRLTPLECERLQGFPDGWTDVDGVSDTQRYRQLGNAVSVPVAYWIGLRAKMALESECA
jgi:DNA (cytosine-5)-methyltransferase 1